VHRASAACALFFALGCAGPAVSSPGPATKATRGDLGTAFRTADEAALAGCAYLWAHEPRATRVEYCGAIYRDSEGIKAGLPETNNKPTGCFRPLDPPGTIAEAGYHNHRQSEDFSREDRRNTTLLGMYLCTPLGLVKRRTPEGTVIVK
jgi:hypothetical protein